MTKAIFVDGRSLYYMQGAFETTFRLNVLYRVLRDETGTVRQVCSAVYTASRKTHPIVRAQIQDAGFALTLADSAGSTDDQILLAHIRALDTSVTEVVLVSNDGDYAVALMGLAERGVKVVWVGTKHTRPGRPRRSLTTKLDQYFGDGTFTFIEIGDFLLKLTPTPRREKGATQDIAFVLRHTGTQETNQRLRDAISALLVEYPGLIVQETCPRREVTDVPGKLRQLRAKLPTDVLDRTESP